MSAGPGLCRGRHQGTKLLCQSLSPVAAAAAATACRAAARAARAAAMVLESVRSTANPFLQVASTGSQVVAAAKGRAAGTGTGRYGCISGYCYGYYHVLLVLVEDEVH